MSAETKFKLGWVPDIPDFRDIPFRLAAPIVIPPIVQLKKIPAPLNQGSLGSCVANAIATAVHYQRIIQTSTLGWSLSRLLLYYNARAAQGWEASDTGSYIRDAIKTISKEGYSVEHRWPYVVSKFAEKPPAKVYEDAKKHKAILYRRVQPTLDDMRGCLAEGTPFVFGFTVYSNFPWTGNGDVPMPTLEEFREGGHAVCAVGYNDSTRMISFQNSWGPTWGNHGRGRIPYEYLTNPGLADDFWSINLVN